MHNSGLYKDPAFSVSVGIVALILEGRPSYSGKNDVLHGYEEERKTSSDSFLVHEFGRVARSEETATQRISQKLHQIRNCPSTSKDYVENTCEIVVGSPRNHSDEFAERIYVNRKFRNSNEFPAVSQYRTATKSYLYKNVDAGWTESSVVYNGLEKIKMLHNISPLKLTPIMKHQSHSKKKSSIGLNTVTQGPHCEQFLKKIGLIKIEGCDEIDHKCEYLNDICRTWQANLSKITSILTKSECICIEVYLGPESHSILLEQWIIKTIDKSSRPIMSLQSLCSAIRSQLYFSQIVAWSEQLTNLTSPLPYEVLNNPRIVKDNQGTCAKLDILFRIRPFDDETLFSEKPLVHQFPDANLTDTTSIQVCLKSLPRINNIPSVISKCEHLESDQRHFTTREKKLNICMEKGKHRCRDEEESPSKEENKFSNVFPLPSSEHREKQLQKYKKRILKREKSKKKYDSNSKSDDSSDNQMGTVSSHSTHKSVSTSSNDISLPTVVTNNKTTQTMIVNANSVGTQTDHFDMTMSFTHECCNNRQPSCLHCDNKQMCNNSTTVNHEADPLEKAEILLQALERTASVNSKRQKESIYVNVHEIIKRQKCCPNSKKQQDSKPIEVNIYQQMENNNKITTPLPDESVVDTNSSKMKYFEKHDCDTCLNYENENREDEFAVNLANSLNLLHSDLCSNVEGRSNPKNISQQRSPSDTVFHFDDASPCSSNSLNTPVQKSSSAPTFYNASSSLSPRFCRLAAIYNRRSRHLSDRSSTSEEQFSDDDTNSFIKTTESGMTRFSRGKNVGLRKFGLLGSLEESLLHCRIPFKHQVVGFKVLLGASGSFCPTQLTVPAVSSFYEIDGNSVLTPYVSEFKLPRKGYCVPRQGTIQVTLLNPLGTVVRMFVVPYDYNDMPPTNVSFIRQRLLARILESNADICPTAIEFDRLSRNEQMRLLRYAIHLRFKTSRSGRLYLHTDVKILVLRRPDCDTAAAHANNSILESSLNVLTVVPEPKYSQRFDK